MFLGKSSGAGDIRSSVFIFGGFTHLSKAHDSSHRSTCHPGWSAYLLSWSVMGK
jgi:hypothetical protein